MDVHAGIVSLRTHGHRAWGCPFEPSVAGRDAARVLAAGVHNDTMRCSDRKLPAGSPVLLLVAT